MDTPPKRVTEETLILSLLEGAYALLNQEVDVYEDRVTGDGTVYQTKIGTRRILTAANLQAAGSVINSKAAQKHFAEQKRGTTVNVRKELQREKLKQIEVLDE